MTDMPTWTVLSTTENDKEIEADRFTVGPHNAVTFFVGEDRVAYFPLDSHHGVLLNDTPKPVALKDEVPPAAPGSRPFWGYVATTYRDRPDGARRGQWAFNLLDTRYKATYEAVAKSLNLFSCAGSSIDPFYDDSRLPQWFEVVAANWAD